MLTLIQERVVILFKIRPGLAEEAVSLEVTSNFKQRKVSGRVFLFVYLDENAGHSSFISIYPFTHSILFTTGEVAYLYLISVF